VIREWDEAAAARAVERCGAEHVFILQQLVHAIRAAMQRRIARGLSPMPPHRSGQNLRRRAG
jgi:hypothetical protein